LRKRFPLAAKPALDDVSFSVKKGEIFGLLGHNGAGKSTALGIMLGLVHPNAGEVTVDKLSVQRDREKALRKVGAIFEAPSFYEYLSGWRNLKVLTALSGGVSKARMKEVVDWVGLSDRIHSKIGTYSHGMRQRLALAQALLPQPEVLLLDEPTDGLDPDGIVEFRKRVHELRDDFGVTILLNSHLLSEVEQTCDRVAILREGRKVYDGACRGLSDDRVRVRLCLDDWEKARRAITALGAEISAGGNSGEVLLAKGGEVADLIAALVDAGIRVSEATPRVMSLEDLYMETRHDNSGDGDADRDDDDDDESGTADQSAGGGASNTAP
jgi:ABC-2 type transport system ATP-binding protein